jgi:proteasome lid subunit RPN8/RPN11
MRRSGAVLMCEPLRVHPAVAHRFNAYAHAAYPREIGGLLRIVGGDMGWTAIDLMIPPQQAGRTSFVLDGHALARWSLDDRDHAVAEWRGLVHSHPSLSPDPSWLDLRTLVAFAGESFAFSLICNAQRRTRDNEYSCHYAQGGPLPLMATGIGVRTLDGASLAGTHSLTSAEVGAIGREVEQLLAVTHG